ncbi:hypothetical protein PNEG_01193 [Pneumocystis murina B123]|uniref:glycogenin glucosyltransferase n=1 Tax=Pneumocystis murina (strain B123) TaxID=1069680 RepID=M7P9D9_PNEMU|nr:hypothetical protein PNEG_01193 [Pneumocystis murina B123]EMR10480.1 hypothetical protein PNEG_01193 [Pneumocystis murina B123]
METYMTLVLTDSYLIGSQVLAWSLRDSGSKKHLTALVTKKNLSESTLKALEEVYDEIISVEPIYSKDIDKLYLLGRPDLRSSFTKIHIWAQEKFKKIIYLDADAFCLKNIDELFDLDTDFAAVPDVGWPDIFNSGVFITKPNISVYNSLLNLAKNSISFDGGDQGLLNFYFSNWKRLPFTYNVVPSFSYQYFPAYYHFKSKISVIHFAGTKKPWMLSKDEINYKPYNELIEKWKSIQRSRTKPQESLNNLSCEKKIHLETKKAIESQESEESNNKNNISYELLTQKTSAIYNRIKFNHKQLDKQDLSSILSKTAFFYNSNYENKQNRSFNLDKLLFIPQPPLLIPEYIKGIEEYNRYRNEIEEFNKYKNEILQIKKIYTFPWRRQKMKATRVFMDDNQENKIDMSKYDIKITKKNVFLYYKTDKMPIFKF